MGYDARGGVAEEPSDAEARLNRLLSMIIETAVEAVGFDAATITMSAAGDLSTVSASDPRMTALDQAQYDACEGPCLDALERDEPLLLLDASEAEMYERFREVAREHGVHTTLSVRIPLDADDAEGLAASLNFYSRHRVDLAERQIRMARTFAGQLAAAMQSVQAYRATARLASQMAEAMRTRAAIEQAKGIVMAARRVTGEEAFQYLAARSMNENRKLRDIAAEIVEKASSPDRRDGLSGDAGPPAP